MYKITVAEFRGYKRLIIHNVQKGNYFYIFDVDFHPIFQQTYAELIVSLEDNAEKFFSFGDCEEACGRIVERLCGYLEGIVPVDYYEYYSTFTVSNESIEDASRNIKI